MTHDFDEATRYCKRCNVLQGYQRLECLDADNVTAITPYIIRRRSLVATKLVTEPESA